MTRKVYKTREAASKAAKKKQQALFPPYDRRVRYFVKKQGNGYIVDSESRRKGG